MSDILIKGMEMPPTCYFCPMTNDGFYLCKANNPYRQLEEDCEERRPSWCPLLPVSPHGRLIDADALVRDNGIKEIPEYYEVVRDAPTIIPAEPSEEQREYEAAVEAAQYCEMYEPTYDSETGAM